MSDDGRRPRRFLPARQCVRGTRVVQLDRRNLVTRDEAGLAFDQQTGLLVAEVDGNPGLDLQYLDYIDAGGVKIPRIAHFGDEDPPLTINVDRIQLNAPIPDSVFAFPEDVARLIRKRSEAVPQ
jgi:hypothetical protein